ncbi:MAG: hypothetical protein ACRECD_02430 [Burkholderiaceae bacterium]
MGRLHDAVLQHDGVEVPVFAACPDQAQAAARHKGQGDSFVRCLQARALARPDGRHELEGAVLFVNRRQPLRQPGLRAARALVVDHGQCHLLEVVLEHLVHFIEQHLVRRGDQQTGTDAKRAQHPGQQFTVDGPDHDATTL